MQKCYQNPNKRTINNHLNILGRNRDRNIEYHRFYISQLINNQPFLRMSKNVLTRLIPTKIKGNFLEYSKLPFISIQSPEQIQDGYVIKHNLLYHEKQDLSLYSSSSFFYVHQLHKDSNYPFRE